LKAVYALRIYFHFFNNSQRVKSTNTIEKQLFMVVEENEVKEAIDVRNECLTFNDAVLLLTGLKGFYFYLFTQISPIRVQY
jgi:hypothetical protein